jgi:hypothetical protein
MIARSRGYKSFSYDAQEFAVAERVRLRATLQKSRRGRRKDEERKKKKSMTLSQAYCCWKESSKKRKMGFEGKSVDKGLCSPIGWLGIIHLIFFPFYCFDPIFLPPY